MKPYVLVSLTLFSATFSATAFSGEIAMNCDSRVANEKTCISLLQDSLKSLGCAESGIRCQLRPWGSDFVKSWICTTQSSNCSPTLQAACPSGSFHTFSDASDVCLESKKTPTSFKGTCKHEQADHSITVKNCSEAPAACAAFGGTSVKCTQPAGYSNQWQASCGFPTLQITETGTSCAELKSKCELINTDKGVKGTLTDCLIK
jgi:hypothetical protein